MGNNSKDIKMKKNWFTKKQLVKNVWGIGEFGHFEEVISYLIVGKKKALLFDTGMGIGNILAVVKQITSLPITVLNSHTHFDHIGGNKLFDNIILFNHKLRKKIARTGIAHIKLKNYIGGKTFFIKPPSEFNLANYNIHTFKWNKLIKNGEIINIDPFKFKVFHTPGHSHDSICLFEETKGYFFSGDTIYPGPIYLHTLDSDFELYKQSIKKLTRIKTVKMIFPAHNAMECNPSIINLIDKTISKIKNIDKLSKINIDSTTSLIVS